MMHESENGLKKKQVFESVIEESPTLKGAQHYDEQPLEFTTEPLTAEQNNALEGDIDAAFDAAFNAESKAGKLPRQRRWSVLAKLSLVGVLGLVVTETLLGLHSAWIESPWLFGLYLTVTSIISLWAGTITVSEWRKLVRLKSVEEAQQTGDRLSMSMQVGEADKFINKLLSQLPKDVDLSRYLSTVNDEHNDAEKLILFDELVLSERDLIAKKYVRRFSQESALLLAASPLALLDMAIILWRNQRMIYKIAECYGIELGYWSRIKLIRGIITNIVYAGTSEIITDLGTQLLSVEMSGKLSARLGQGLGGGLLTARLGYQAMALCRPVSFQDKSRPKLSGIHKELLLDLKDFSASVLTKNASRNKDFTSKAG